MGEVAIEVQRRVRSAGLGVLAAALGPGRLGSVVGPHVVVFLVLSRGARRAPVHERGAASREVGAARAQARCGAGARGYLLACERERLAALERAVPALRVRAGDHGRLAPVPRPPRGRRRRRRGCRQPEQRRWYETY